MLIKIQPNKLKFSHGSFFFDLYRKLSHSDYSVFFDIEHHSLTPTQNFPDLIKKATQFCELAIVVLSEHFLISPWPMRELCAFADRHRRSRLNDPAIFSSPGFPNILPLFFKISTQDLKDEQKLRTWHNIWTRWAQDHQDGNAISANRMSYNASECEAAVKLLRSLKGIVRRSEEEEGETNYIDRVMEVVNHCNVAAFNPLQRPLEDPDKFHVGKERLCKVYSYSNILLI
jgi:hypothetical protein